MTAKTLIPGPPEPSIPPPPPFDPSEPIDAPPDYRAITIVPEAPFLTPAQVPPIAASQVKVERDSELNVTTYDAIVESNPDELWRYFLTYSDKPGLEARIEGWRYEDRWRTESYFENGEHRSRQVHERERVTDFMVSVNLSAYIQPGWKRLVAIDQKGNFRPIREVLEEFTLNKERLKEIGMTKQVQWDFAQLTAALTSIARPVYPHTITVTYHPMNSQILACSSNETAKLARSTWVRCLLVVTCLWICALPVWLMRKKVHKLVLEFDAVPVQVFWERNYWIVRGAVAARGRRRIVAI